MFGQIRRLPNRQERIEDGLGRHVCGTSLDIDISSGLDELMRGLRVNPSSTINYTPSACNVGEELSI